MYIHFQSTRLTTTFFPIQSAGKYTCPEFPAFLTLRVICESITLFMLVVIGSRFFPSCNTSFLYSCSVNTDCKKLSPSVSNIDILYSKGLIDNTERKQDIHIDSILRTLLQFILSGSMRFPSTKAFKLWFIGTKRQSPPDSYIK